MQFFLVDNMDLCKTMKRLEQRLIGIILVNDVLMVSYLYGFSFCSQTRHHHANLPRAYYKYVAMNFHFALIEFVKFCFQFTAGKRCWSVTYT